MDATLACIVAATVSLTGIMGWCASAQIQRLSHTKPIIVTPVHFQVQVRRQAVRVSPASNSPSPVSSAPEPEPEHAPAPAPISRIQVTPHDIHSKQAKTRHLVILRSLTTPAGLGRYLHGFLNLNRQAAVLQKTNWVSDNELVEYTQALEELQSSHKELFFRPFRCMKLFRAVEIVKDNKGTHQVIHTIPDEQEQFSSSIDEIAIILHGDADLMEQASLKPVKDIPRGHFSVIFMDTKNKEVVAMDTRYVRSDQEIVSTLDKIYPKIKPITKLKYTLWNHTGRKCKQTGATCGPWVLWLVTAMVMNYNGCRARNGRIIVDPLDACTTTQVEEFYQSALQ